MAKLVRWIPLWVLCDYFYYLNFDIFARKPNITQIPIIETIRTSPKFVICSKISLKSERVPITDFLPEAQLSVFTGKCHIHFVYLRDSNGVNTGDR